jgi:hypothetical protein
MAHPLDRFDAGLVRPDGTLRPSYAALVRGLAGATTVAAPAAAAPVRWSATWSAVHPRQLVLRARCRTGVARCTGTVAATLRTRAVGARAAIFARVATGRPYRTTTTRRTATVRLTVSRAAWRRARRAPTRRVVLTAAATRPTKATIKVTVRLARPAA